MDKIHFNTKLASYFVYNFSILIIEEYNLKRNKPVFNTDIKTNEFKWLNVNAKEKEEFIEEILNDKIVIYWKKNNY